MSKVSGFIKATLNLFKAVPNLENEASAAPYTLDNKKNLEYGFFITENAFKACPAVAGNDILKFIKDNFGYNMFELNRSFYKSFESVTQLTPEQIFLDRILYYMTTIWSEAFGIFDKERVYIPNAMLNLPADAKPVKITIIDVISNAEIEERLNTLVKSGAALSEETLNDIVLIVKFLKIELNVDDIANKEFAIRLCEILKILPKDPVQFLRYMIYIATGSTLLIKSGSVVYNVRKSKNKSTVLDGMDDFSVKREELQKLIAAFKLKIKPKLRVSLFDGYFSQYIDLNGLEKLASIFHRFKPLWLAFKPHSDYLRQTVNKMRKLADRCHEPATPKFLERLTSASEIDLKQLKNELSKITTYRKISIANALLCRSAQPENIFYSLRNDKIFVDNYSGSLKFDIKIYIPERFTYAAPVSEKKFVGNIPFGSSYQFSSKSGVVGVHWFNLVANGHELHIILDLHLNSEGLDIGWNNDFRYENSINTKERKIIFSGDMVDAPIDKGGATEAYFLGEPLTSKVIMLNLNYFNRNYLDFYNPHRTDKSKPMRGVPFKLFLADVEQESIDRQYLIDAHEVAFCIPNVIDSNEMLLGFIHSNELGEKKFYFYSRNTGNRIVATTDNVTLQFNSAMATVAENSLSFNAILKKAGAIFDGVTAENCDINLDPAEVTKDVLIGLLAKKK